MKKNTLVFQLTNKPLKSPCSESWESMEGNDKVRNCKSCSRDVYFLSAMTPFEAEINLLNANDSVPCIRYSTKADGSVFLMQPPLTFWNSSRALVAASTLGALIIPALFPLPTRADETNIKSRSDEQTQCMEFQTSPNAQSPASNMAANTSLSGPPGNGVKSSEQSESRTPSGIAQLQIKNPAGFSTGMPALPGIQTQFGTLRIMSKVQRQVKIKGLSLTAPFEKKWTLGTYTMEVIAPSGKMQSVKFEIKKNQETIVHLD